MSTDVLAFDGVIKAYGGLRPLRLRQLRVAPGEHVGLAGFDQATAELFVNLVTGATLPDEGTVTIFGRATSAITDSTDWLATVEHFGIVSERAVLLDGLTVVQNLSMPFTLEIEPPPDDVRMRATALGREAGLRDDVWDRPLAELDAVSRARVRLARALALDPVVLLLEHPTASVPPGEAPAYGRAIRELAARRNAALLALTADRPFAEAVAGRVLTLDASSGQLRERRRGWFGR